VPRRVDHEERRQEIVEALWRIAAKGGVPAASFREVASEAGVSVSLVQHYFGTKDALMLAALNRLAGQVAARGLAAMEALGERPSPREILETLFEVFMPADDDRRTAMLLFYAFQIAALTDPALARAESLAVPRGLETLLAEQVRRALDLGLVAKNTNPDQEAVVLLSAISGVSLSVLSGQHTLDEGRAAARYMLDRLFTTRPAAHRRRPKETR